MKRSDLVGVLQQHLDTSEDDVRNTHARILNAAVDDLVRQGVVENDAGPLLRTPVGLFL